MTHTSDALTSSSIGLREGMIVQEIGWDDDVDEDLREAVMDAIDADLIEDADEAVDAVWLWLRDDVDVVDALVDALRDLGPEGFILVVTPKVGRPGQIDPADLEEGVTTAGMALTRSESLADDWLIYKVVRPRGRR